MWIVFTRPKKFKIGSFLISAFTRKRNQDIKKVPSHVMIVSEKEFVLEARYPKVKLDYFPAIMKHNRVLRVFRYTGESKRELQDFLRLYFGKRYDLKGLFQFGYYLARKKLTGKKIPSRLPWENNKEFFCSELVHFVDSTIGEADPNGQMREMLTHSNFDLIFDENSKHISDWYYKDMANKKG